MYRKKAPLKNVLISIVLLSCSLTTAADELFEYPLGKSATASNKMINAIKLNDKIAELAAQSVIDVTLPDATQMSLTVERKIKNAGGSLTVFASDDSGHQLTLTKGKSTVFGTLIGEDRHYSIGHMPDQGQVLIDLKSELRPELDLGDDGKIPPTFKNRSRKSLTPESMQKQAAAMSGIAEVSLLVVYSPEFKTGFNGDPLARINQAIAFTNQSLSRSNILMRFKLNQAIELDFPNNSGNGTLLDQVTNGSGAFSTVGSLRNQAGADMVAVMRFISGNFGSGVAWINGDNPNFAFSVTQFSQVGFDSVFAHELGHNMGSGHERDSVNSTASSPCTFNLTGYSCGHGNQSANWGTIMSRLNSARVNEVFSNPGLTCLGEPCGIPQGQTGAADNKASFDFARVAVSSFRNDPPSLPMSNDSAGALPATILILLDEETEEED